jgi:hypothetical protein
MKHVNVDIVGNGNVVGNGNRTISVTNNTRINNNGGSGGSGGSGGGGGAGGEIAVLAAVVSVIMCWLYVRHIDGIYDVLTKAALLSSLPILPLVIGFLWRLRTEEGTWGDMVKLFINPVVTIIVLSLLNFGYGRLDGHVIQMATHMQARDFWNGLSEYGHRVVFENIVGTTAWWRASSASAAMESAPPDGRRRRGAPGTASCRSIWDSRRPRPWYTIGCLRFAPFP